MTRTAAPKGQTVVLQAIAPSPFGGAETAVLGLAAGLRTHCRVLLGILADRGSGPFLERARAAGLEAVVLDSAGRDYWRDIRALRTIIRTHQVGLVHSHGYRADGVGLVAARLERIPNVATAHGFTGGSRRNRINQFIGVQALKHSSAVIAVASALVDELGRRGVPGDGVHFIPNAWSPPGGRLLDRAVARQRLGLAEGETVIGWVGRLSPEKGVDLAIEAVAALPVPALLAVVGDGPERAQSVELAASLAASDRIRWLGSVNDAWQVLPAFDLLLLSSRTEGTPLVLLEAMHAKVPIVSTPVGGVPDLLRGGLGWLARDASASAIRDSLMLAFEDRARWGRVAERAREHLREENATGAWVERHLAIYRSLLPSGGI